MMGVQFKRRPKTITYQVALGCSRQAGQSRGAPKADSRTVTPNGCGHRTNALYLCLFVSIWSRRVVSLDQDQANRQIIDNQSRWYSCDHV